MSEPKKYEYVSDGYTARFINAKTGHAAPYGEYVLHSDYARLKAEVERLDTLCKQLMAQHSDISCENIMLRKAGDAMAGSHITLIQVYLKDSSDEWHQELHNRWNAAKEGKPQP